HGIPLLTGGFHQSGNGVADQAENVGDGSAGSAHALFGSTAHEFHSGRGSHGAGSTHFSLTSALGACNSGVAGDEVADGTSIEQGTDHLVIGEAILLLERHKDAGNDTGAAGSGSGDNEAH